MKKAKIMLTSIAILAVVGGALAFKAQRLQRYCIVPNVTPAQQGITTTLNCNQFVLSKPGGALKYEIPTNGAHCNGVITCTAFPLVNE